MIDPRELKTGATYSISKQTPLMPELNPADPIAALDKTIVLPVKSEFRITATGKRANSIWYQVTTKHGDGWINSTALLGQEISRTKGD
jgi:hypothetical protein